MSEGIWVWREGFEVCVGKVGGESEKTSERVWVGGVVGGVVGGEGIGRTVDLGLRSTGWLVGGENSALKFSRSLGCQDAYFQRHGRSSVF